MRFIAILVCKIFVAVGKVLNKGTSLPGAVALKLCPDIMSRLTFPEAVVAVTGSNGKTSTVEMIANVLSAAGKRVVWNKEGSNQIEGVATLLLKNSSFSGKIKGDAVVLESDERYARHTFKYVKPTHFAVTNLYRDQMTRNVHPYWIYEILKDAVDLIPNAKLILNGDDPIIRNYGLGRENCVYFGMAENKYSTAETDALYNDCYYCPNCKNKLEYEYFHYSHLGKYNCPSCGYSAPELSFTVDTLDLDGKKMSVNGNTIELAFASRYNVYNLCAAFSVCSLLGISESFIAEVLSDFIMKNGRVVRFTAGENRGVLITSKHENSTSYNQSLEYIAAQKDPSLLVIIVDAVSRKYYTSETSWLWDISFEKLKNSNVRKILLCGKYAYDLSVRFSVSDFGDIEILTVPDLDEMGRLISEPTDFKLFAVTCFSDKDKLYGRVKVETPTAK